MQAPKIISSKHVGPRHVTVSVGWMKIKRQFNWLELIMWVYQAESGILVENWLKYFTIWCDLSINAITVHIQSTFETQLKQSVRGIKCNILELILYIKAVSGTCLWSFWQARAPVRFVIGRFWSPPGWPNPCQNIDESPVCGQKWPNYGAHRESKFNISFAYLHSGDVLKSRWSLHVGVSRRVNHDDVMKWKHFPRYWPFVRGIHRSPVNSPHKGQWRGALMFSLICVWINSWANNRKAGDLRRYRVLYDVSVMIVTAGQALWSTIGRIGRIAHGNPECPRGEQPNPW